MGIFYSMGTCGFPISPTTNDLLQAFQQFPSMLIPSLHSVRLQDIDPIGHSRRHSLVPIDRFTELLAGPHLQSLHCFFMSEIAFNLTNFIHWAALTELSLVHCSTDAKTAYNILHRSPNLVKCSIEVSMSTYKKSLPPLQLLQLEDSELYERHFIYEFQNFAASCMKDCTP
ncbi:hypothetical protein CPB84DRAFT_657552 [Gymnopilus junonius]|uniref:Uncharacterized protein n=1 Tax=Gymnopilus junonius TaxID=109634 RepID=A0A9P5NUU6_GYMJU|nr:hypothetical protein CPB84DRAFT_657552 [Gymnopilus junonius]